MNILPRLLYPFQTLPIEIPEKQKDKIISRYLYQGKKPRIIMSNGKLRDFQTLKERYIKT